MVDEKIVDLYWMRSEDAITETATKYGKYCYLIAYNILRDTEDAQECVNDTYLSAWNLIPEYRPSKLSSFLGKITRNLALNRYDYNKAQKRGGNQIDLALNELLECVSNNKSPGDIVDAMILEDVLNSFLESLDERNRNIFVERYWCMSSIKEIAKKHSLTESNVKVSLYRSRKILKLILAEEEIL